MTAWTVAAEHYGMRLDRFLDLQVPHLSRTRLRALIAAGSVRVDGDSAPPGRRLQVGQRVTLESEGEGPTAMTPEALPLEVLYEDAHLIVVVKPAGMVVHPAGRHRTGTLANALAWHFNVAGRADPPVRPGIAHRLDRETSGVLAAARTQEALSALTVQFQRRTVEKLYLACAAGDPGPGGEWEAPIGSDPTTTPRWGVRPEGRPARTRFRRLERIGEWSLLELEPLTGRTNQLRLHCAHFGHPIAGDRLFGRGEEPGLSRLFLHAHRLGLVHPVTGEPLRFEAPLPPELAGWLDRLRAGQVA